MMNEDDERLSSIRESPPSSSSEVLSPWHPAEKQAVHLFSLKEYGHPSPAMGERGVSRNIRDKTTTDAVHYFQITASIQLCLLPQQFILCHTKSVRMSEGRRAVKRSSSDRRRVMALGHPISMMVASCNVLLIFFYPQKVNELYFLFSQKNIELNFSSIRRGLSNMDGFSTLAPTHMNIKDMSFFGSLYLKCHC